MSLTASITNTKNVIANIKSRQELKCWLGNSPSTYSRAEEYKLVTLHKNGKLEDHGKTLTHDQMKKLKKRPSSWEERIEQSKQIKEFDGNLYAIEAHGDDPATVFDRQQKEDLDKAERRLSELEFEKRYFDKKVKNWTLQPLPGTASVSAKMDAVVEKLSAVVADSGVRLALEEAAGSLAG